MLVRVSNSPYVAPIVLVQKPDGTIWVCVDYTTLHENNMKDYFSLPRIDDLLDKLRNARCMTHWDLRSAYNKYECQMLARKMIPLVHSCDNLPGPHTKWDSLFTRNVSYGVWPLQ